MNNANQPRNSHFRWETLAHVMSVISTIVAIYALYVGVSQFKISTEMLKEERENKIAEGRPYIVVNSTKVNIYTERRYNMPPCWYYSLSMQNIGVRAAEDLVVYSVLISTDTFFKEIESIAIDSFSYVNPLIGLSKKEHFGQVDFGKLRKYYLKVAIRYKDGQIPKTYKNIYYYSLDLQDESMYPYDTNLTLSDIFKNDIGRIDSLTHNYADKFL